MRDIAAWCQVCEKAIGDHAEVVVYPGIASRGGYPQYAEDGIVSYLGTLCRVCAAEESAVRQMHKQAAAWAGWRR